MIPVAAAGTDPRTRPIFVLAAGGRTGSTLVQRLLISTRQALIWGEHGGTLMAALGGLIQGMQSWLHREGEGQFDLFLRDGWNSFIPNLNPGLESFVDGVRAAFTQSLALPAAKLGYPRWGFKEIRYDGAIAGQLKMLFPNAAFVVVTRHPCDMLRSIKATEWYGKDYGESPEAFLGNWARLSSSLTSAVPELGPAYHLRYEDLVAQPDATVGALAAHVGIELHRFDRSALWSRHRGTVRPPVPLDDRDMAALRDAAVVQAAATLGYDLGLAGPAEPSAQAATVVARPNGPALAERTDEHQIRPLDSHDGAGTPHDRAVRTRPGTRGRRS